MKQMTSRFAMSAWSMVAYKDGHLNSNTLASRYKDTLKASLKDFNIPTESWEQIAQDRAKWRGLIRSEYEAKRISEAEQKHAQRKARA